MAKLAKLARQPYNGARNVKVKYVMSSGVVTCFVNGRKVGSSKKLKGKLDRIKSSRPDDRKPSMAKKCKKNKSSPECIRWRCKKDPSLPVPMAFLQD